MPLNNPYSNSVFDYINGTASNEYAGQPLSKASSLNYSDYNGDWKRYLEDMAANGDADSLDRLLNYMMSEQSSMTAREWTAGREDTQYQRLVKDLKAAGINPYVLLNSGGSPVSSASSGNSYTGSYASNAALKKETNEAKWASIITGILSTIIMAVAIAV